MSESQTPARTSIPLDHAATEARRAWLEPLATWYDVAAPEPQPGSKRTLSDLDEPYARRLREQHGFSPEQVRCHLTNVRVKLFEWAGREPHMLFALPAPLSAETASLAIGVVLLPLLELGVYDDLPPYSRAVLATLSNNALATLVAEQRLAYGRAANGYARSAAALGLVRRLATPELYDGTRTLLRYLLDEARWPRAMVERAVFVQAQGPLIAPVAAWYHRAPSQQHTDGSRFALLLLAVLAGERTGAAAGNVSVATVLELLRHGDRALLRQVWQQLSSAAKNIT